MSSYVQKKENAKTILVWAELHGKFSAEFDKWYLQIKVWKTPSWVKIDHFLNLFDKLETYITPNVVRPNI